MFKLRETLFEAFEANKTALSNVNTITVISSKSYHLDYLDGWRGIAIFLVLASHFFQIDNIDLGRMGVDIFFVLSGMLMSNILFVKRVPLITFYKRRISRIIPAFFIFLSVISFFGFIYDVSDEHNNYLYNILFIRAYYPVFPDIQSSGLPLGHLWSLNIEEHVYILLSVISFVYICKIRICFTLLLMGIFSIVLQIIYVKFPYLSSDNYTFKTEVVASFLLLSAGYLLVKESIEKFIPSWLPIVTFALSFVCYSDYSPHWSAQWVVAPFLLAFTVNHLNLLPPFTKKILSVPWLKYMGVWSFSIYLWQQPFYYWGTKNGEAFYMAGPILFVISVFIGFISYYLIESPVRRYLNNNW